MTGRDRHPAPGQRRPDRRVGLVGRVRVDRNGDAAGEDLGLDRGLLDCACQSLEDGAFQPAVVLRALEIDRDGRRARAVGARRHELGVAEDVACVSVDSAAAGPVAEECEARGVLTRPAGLGAGAGNEPALLGLHG